MGSGKRSLQLRSLLSSRSYERVVHDRESLQSALDQMVERHRFDVIQVEASFMAHYTFPAETVVVLDEHNVEYEIQRRTAAVARGLPRKLHNYVDYLKLKREEERVWRRVDACAVTSERDEMTVRRAYPAARTAVVPNAVDTEFFSPGTREAERSTIVFFGTISYYPNTDALLYFMRDIYPTLKRSHPSVRLLIVGQSPPASIQRWAGPDVLVTGGVDDVRPYIERARVVIAPLRIGGGTRLKILEAMGMGKPVVSTTLGAEGLAVSHERDILIADRAQDYAAQVARVLDDDDLAASLGSAARSLVETRYDWKHSAQKLEALYRSALLARHSLPAAADNAFPSSAA
jgi:glycosyltransferase involved in cell wall biosynthesis